MYIIKICTVTKMDMADSLYCSYLKRVLEQGCNFQKDSWQLDSGIYEWSYYTFFFNAYGEWGFGNITKHNCQILAVLTFLTWK